jgi:hypothetical protein
LPRAERWQRRRAFVLLPQTAIEHHRAALLSGAVSYAPDPGFHDVLAGPAHPDCDADSAGVI